MAVPRAQWVGSKSGGFGCSFRGYERPFDAATLRTLYRDDKVYVVRLEAAVRSAVAGRWLTQADADTLLAEAKHDVANWPR